MSGMAVCYGCVVCGGWLCCMWSMIMLYVSYDYVVCGVWLYCMLYVKYGYVECELWFMLYASYGYVVCELWLCCMWAMAMLYVGYGCIVCGVWLYCMDHPNCGALQASPYTDMWLSAARNTLHSRHATRQVRRMLTIRLLPLGWVGETGRKLRDRNAVSDLGRF